MFEELIDDAVAFMNASICITRGALRSNVLLSRLLCYSQQGLSCPCARLILQVACMANRRLLTLTVLLQEGKKQIEGCKSLLSIYDLELILSTPLDYNKVPKKIVVLAPYHRVLNIANKLLNLFGPPSIVPLINRNQIIVSE
ncbi:Uncharacterised protein [Klebsiella pneumoniae]|nr:Uncharacterised protein [Klebsiella pneumoniae]SLT27877.1 Uncharacterised protein [Klebsiella pneumoniae]